MYGYSAGIDRDNLLEHALARGEQLSNTIGETIMKQDALISDYSTYALINSQSQVQTQSQLNAFETESNVSQKSLSLCEKHKVLAYIKGDPMSPNEEKQVMDTFRTLSTSDICDLTSKSFAFTQSTCKCETCKAYNKLNFYSNPLNPVAPTLQLKSMKKSSNSFNNFGRKTGKMRDFECLHFVDSLKVALHSFMLTDEGKIKVKNAFISGKGTNKGDLMTVTYFIEYGIPNCISKTVKKQAKVDTGLNSNNFVKMCSKKLINNVVYFKQISLHDIQNLENINLEGIDLKFKITCRTLRQKKANVIGIGKFNFSDFLTSPTLTSHQELVVLLKEDSPIVTGTVKLQLQLGCDKLYFGKEFIDSLQTDKENRSVTDLTNLGDNLDETFTLTDPSERNIYLKAPIKDVVPSQRTKSPVKVKNNIVIQKLGSGNEKPVEGSRHLTIEPKNSQKIEGNYKSAEVQLNLNNSTVKYHSFELKGLELVDEPVRNLKSSQNVENLILFGFIFVSEVEYLENKQETYFTCQPFCQNDFVCSDVTIGGSHPCFNFHQVIPYIYDEKFLFKLRDNYMILEFLEKSRQDCYRDEAIGICKIPLHQYYLAFRNPTILNYLARNKVPVIGTDWYEPITNPITGTITGNVQILVALGSEQQVRNLQRERGFMDDIVKKAKKKIIDPTKSNVQTTSITRNTRQPEKHTKERFVPRTQTVKKVDKSTSVTPNLVEAHIMADQAQCTKFDNRLETIQNYLQQLVAMKTQQQHHHQVEEETLSAPATTCSSKPPQSINNVNETHSTTALPVQAKKTEYLLETLQSAMNIEPPASIKKDTFKAQIVVESALHLPARKKCIAKKIKGKVVREKLLPSTYVSYEIKDGGAVKTSQVVQKSTSPTWNMKNDVVLPIEFLTNSNRRLLFKVWKKSNNGSTIPNMQIDTIIGFATVDLTVLLAGLPTIEGWFNIMDFTNKCNGQIKINVTPLENVINYNKQSSTSTIATTKYTSTSSTNETSVDEPESLSRALKRKFIELDEISQRLKARLNNVTDELNDDSDTINDDIVDEFEKDINTLCVEDDYDLLDFAKEAQDLNMHRVSSSLHKWQMQGSSSSNLGELLVTTDDNNHKSQVPSDNSEYALQFAQSEQRNDIIDISETKIRSDSSSLVDLSAPSSSANTESHSSTASSSLTTLDKQLVEGKERIDHLLQKLTLISQRDSDMISEFSSRYVSGCSTSACADGNIPQTNSNSNRNVEADILSELGIKDFDASKLFDASLVSFNGNLEDILDLNNSDVSASNVRVAPDGEGNTSSDDKLNDE